jgi:nicotinate phosphoribosyltransferase
MFTDLYALTMAAAYVATGRDQRVVTCEMFTRRLPRHRRFMVSAGLPEILDALTHWQLDPEEIAFLRTVPALRPGFTPALEDRLRRLRFTGDAWAMPEGTVFFPDEPVLRITAPVLEAQLLETYLLGLFNQAASVASKAARVLMAARGKPVLEFGMRRVHPEASLTASRVASVVGLAGTSNVAAGMAYGLPLQGTMAHAYVMTHDSEEEAFATFLRTFPDGPTLLVDTYDTLEGVRRAARVAGQRLGGVRLDSGDLGELSRAARGVLDQAGLTHARIVASGDLDERKVAALEASGAPIDVYAVGTELAASADAPTLGAVYKVVHDHHAGRDLAKFSSSKGTLAGVHQVVRHAGPDGAMSGDVITLDGEPHPDGTPLLQPVVRRGDLLGPLPTLDQSRAYVATQLRALPEPLRRLDDETFVPYPVTTSDAVARATSAARQRSAAAAR